MLSVKYTQSAIAEALKKYPIGTLLKVEDQPHLYIYVGKLAPTLHIDVWHKLGRHKKSIGKLTPRRMKTMLEMAHAEIDRILSSSNPRFANLTVNDVQNDLVKPASKRNKSQKKYRKLYENYIEPILGSCPISALDSLKIQKCLSRLPDDLSDATYNHVRSVIMRICSLALKHGLTNHNPCLAVPPRKLNNVVERYMSPDETRAFLEAAAQFPNDPQALALLLSLYTGARIGEVITIERDNVASDASYYLVLDSKSGQHHKKHVPEGAREVVRKAMALSTNQYLFSSTTRSGTHIAIPRKRFGTICKLAGIKTYNSEYPVQDGFSQHPLTIHCLRKTLASAVLKATGSIDFASRVLGHSDIRVTQRYAFLRDDDLAVGVEAAGALLGGGS